jgi:CRP-like cAMP-binding protein
MIRAVERGVVDAWAALAARLDPAAARPCLADHVERKEFAERGGRAYTMLADTRNRVYYRVEATESAVLPLLDGSRTLGEIVVAYFQKSGELDFGAVADLVDTLYVRGFLTDRFIDTDAALRRALAHRGPRARVAQFLQTHTAEWPGVDRFARACYRSGMWVFFRPVGSLLASVILAAGALAFATTVPAHHEYSLDPQSIGLGLVVLLLLSFAVTVVHELGRASRLVHEGRRVNGAGFRISFGTPNFFVDDSDARMLDRGRRIAMNFAGTYFDGVVTAVAAIALWAWPDGSLATTLYAFVVLNFFVLILNLVPLLELDGYRMLCDALRIDDLRPRSLAFVRHDVWTKLRARERFTRADIGLALFGTLGVAFTVVGVAFAIFLWWSTFGALTTRLWDAGALGIVALALLLTFVASPILRAAFDALQTLAASLGALGERLRFHAQRGRRQEAADLLDSQPAFDQLPPEVLAEVTARMRLNRFGACTTVVRQGDRADAYYVVRTGELDIIEEDRTLGTERLIHRIGRGEAFGEVGVATGARRRATVRARTPVELFVVSKGTFDRLLADHVRVPEFAPTVQALAELRALDVFSHFRDDALARLREEGAWCNVRAGDVLVREGEPGDAFYAIESGRLDVLTGMERVRTLGPGRHFGEIALLADVPRTATVRAVTPARVFRLGREGFDRLVADAFRHDKLATRAQGPHARA